MTAVIDVISEQRAKLRELQVRLITLRKYRQHHYRLGLEEQLIKSSKEALVLVKAIVEIDGDAALYHNLEHEPEQVLFEVHTLGLSTERRRIRLAWTKARSGL